MAGAASERAGRTPIVPSTPMRSLSSVWSVLFVTALVFAVGVESASAQMEMPPRSLGEVIEQAEAQETPILVEIYAPWCPYCQRMQEEVYADATVRSYLDRKFTYVRLNSDTTAGTHEFAGRELSSEGLASALGARGVPTTVFMTPDGTPIAPRADASPSDESSRPANSCVPAVVSLLSRT